MYLHSLFTTKENNKTGKNVFTIYVCTEVEIIVLKLWKKVIFNTDLQNWPLSRHTGPYVCYLNTRIYVCPMVPSLC
jgi:hypothetical protein